MEKSDTVVAQFMFLHTMHQIRVSGDKCLVFYLDKTWVKENHTLQYMWQNSTINGGLKVPAGKGS
jgi:hypothetical protein